MLNIEDAGRFDIADELSLTTKIKVLGIGGGGGNAVARMMQSGLTGVEFYALNTDRQALANSPVPNKIVIGAKVTNGLGAGSNPEVGRQAALEDTEKIIEVLEGADMVFITAGLGGGTGTGAAPIVASLAKELNALTVAVVTKPFQFEGTRRKKIADRGLSELASTVDTVISIPNQRLLDTTGDDTSFVDAFRQADDVLLQAVQGISDIIMTPGLINRDFADIRAIMAGMGHAILSTATASGPKAVVEAARQAITCPLLDDGGVSGARGLLINITGPKTLRMRDINEACTMVSDATGNDEVHVSFGVVVSEGGSDEVKVTVIATGFDRDVAQADPVVVSRVKPAPVSTAPKTVPATFVAPQVIPVVAEPVVEQEPEIEPLAAAVAAGAETESAVESVPYRDSEVAPQPVTQPSNRREPVENDLDIPAFMRRERRLF